MEKCLCCGNETITVRGDFEICDICGWEDDDIQGDSPDYTGGANGISLNEAKKAWVEGKALGPLKKAWRNALPNGFYGDAKNDKGNKP